MDHPRFGRAEPCACVLAEAEDVRRERLLRISNLRSLARFTFDGLIAGGRSGGNRLFADALAAAHEFAAEPRGWLVLSGPSGSGKTHLAAAIANERIARGEPALFMVVPDLLDHLRASYSAGDDELAFTPLFDQVRNAPLLLLDDVDAAAGTPWAREKLFQIVNHRFNEMLPTVFTSSIRPQQLDERLGTRLLDAGISRVLVLETGLAAGYQQVGGMTRERLASMEFRDFDLRGAGLNPQERDSVIAAVRTAQAFAEHPSGFLTLQGANGCGKTHLAAAIANRLLARGESVFFAVVPDLLDHLRASFAPNRGDAGYDALFESVRTAPLLVLDDLGAQATSSWAEEKLYQLVNYRVLGGLPTIVTTDLSTNRLQEAHPRIFARLADSAAGVVVPMLAPHYRLGRSSAGSGAASARRR